MTGRRTLLAALAGVAVLGAATAVVLTGGDGEAPATTIAAEPVAETTEPIVTTTQPVGSDVEDDPDPAGEACTPDPGIEVRARGDIEGFPPGEERDGLVSFGGAAGVDFRLDAPGNRNLILFRLIYFEGSDTHGWQEVDPYDDSEFTFDPATGRFTGWFMLGHAIGLELPSDNAERTDIDLVYDPAGSRVSGTFTHPERTFELDLEAEEVAREFFDDVICYPVPTDNPVEESNSPATP